MTLDEAIKHAEEVAKEKEKTAERIRDTMKSEIALNNADWCKACAEQHRQFAEWLKDYKQLKEQQSNEDCVSRQAVITIIQNHWWNCRDIDRLVNELPPVTPTREKGKWIRHYCNNGNLHHIECSNCHDWHENFLEHKYCLNCGAEMESEEWI